MFLRGRLREMYRVVKQKAIAESFINCVSYNLFPIPRFQLLSLLSLPLCPLSLFSLSACHLFSVSLSASPSPFLYHFHFVFSLSEHACLPSYTIATRISTACRSSPYLSIFQSVSLSSCLPLSCFYTSLLPIYLSFSSFLFLPVFLCHVFMLFSLSLPHLLLLSIHLLFLSFSVPHLRLLLHFILAFLPPPKHSKEYLHVHISAFVCCCFLSYRGIFPSSFFCVPSPA